VLRKGEREGRAELYRASATLAASQSVRGCAEPSLTVNDSAVTQFLPKPVWAQNVEKG